MALRCCVQSTGGLRSVWLCWRASQEHLLGQAEPRSNWRSGGVLPFGCDRQPSRGADYLGAVPAVVQALLAPLPALTPSSWPSSTSGLRERAAASGAATKVLRSAWKWFKAPSSQNRQAFLTRGAARRNGGCAHIIGSMRYPNCRIVPKSLHTEINNFQKPEVYLQWIGIDCSTTGGTM